MANPLRCSLLAIAMLAGTVGLSPGLAAGLTGNLVVVAAPADSAAEDPSASSALHASVPTQQAASTPFGAATGIDLTRITAAEFVAQVTKFRHRQSRDMVRERFLREATTNPWLHKACRDQVAAFGVFGGDVQRAGLPVAAVRAFVRVVLLANLDGKRTTTAGSVVPVQFVPSASGDAVVPNAVPRSPAGVIGSAKADRLSGAASPVPSADVDGAALGREKARPAPVPASTQLSVLRPVALGATAPRVTSSVAAAPVATEAVVPANPHRVERPSLALPLPGIGEVPGLKLAKGSANVIRIGTDLSEVVPVARRFPNRISTPFTAPQAVDNKEDVTVKQEGTSLFVTMKTDEATAIFVRDADQPSGPVISLTLVPRDIGPQTILLQLDTVTDAKVASSATALTEETAYEGRLVSLLRQVATGGTPPGFARAPLPSAVGKLGVLLVAPQTRWSTRDMDIFAYRVENTADGAIDIDEAVFYQDGVRAIAVLETRLAARESTLLFVVAEKSR